MDTTKTENNDLTINHLNWLGLKNENGAMVYNGLNGRVEYVDGEFHYSVGNSSVKHLKTEKDANDLVIPIKNKLIGERNAAIIKSAADEKESKSKALVYNLTMDGSTAVHFSFGCLIEGLKAECEDMDDESLMDMEFTISFKQMTDKEIEDLPEFDGF